MSAFCRATGVPEDSSKLVWSSHTLVARLTQGLPTFDSKQDERHKTASLSVCVGDPVSPGRKGLCLHGQEN